MAKDRPRIVIVGGGFGGVYTAIALEKLLGHGREAEIALISKENYLTFQPMLPEVISGSIGLLDTITPIRRLCPSTHLYTRTVERIDLEGRRAIASAGFGARQLELDYDHLVIALGNVTSFAGQPGLAEHALPFKYLGDALALRNRAIQALEEADTEPSAEARRALLTFVVAGGGFSGVEAVAELNDFVRAAAKSFHHVDPREIRVVLLHAQGLILPELPRSLAEFAQRILMRRGVEIKLNTRLQGATMDAALLDGGERIAARTVVSTVPSARIRWWRPCRARRRGAGSWSTGISRFLTTRACGRSATAPGSSTRRRASPARRRRSTRRARPGASPKTSPQRSGARAERPSRSARSARWARSATDRPSPRFSACRSRASLPGGSGARSTC